MAVMAEASDATVVAEAQMIDVTLLTRLNREWSEWELIKLNKAFGVKTRDKGDKKVIAVLGHRDKPAIIRTLIGGLRDDNFECVPTQIAQPQ